MSITAATYNRMRGPGLTVMVMDIVRHAHQAGEELSTRQLTRRVAQRNGYTCTEDTFAALYHRVRVVVRSLADAQLIHTHTTFHKVHRVNVTLITLPACSASPQT